MYLFICLFIYLYTKEGPTFPAALEQRKNMVRTQIKCPYLKSTRVICGPNLFQIEVRVTIAVFGTWDRDIGDAIGTVGPISKA